MNRYFIVFFDTETASWHIYRGYFSYEDASSAMIHLYHDTLEKDKYKLVELL